MSVATMNWPGWFPRVLWTRRMCPCCKSTHFKNAELRPHDELFSMFALRPIRCMFCWRRYYWFALRMIP